MINVYNFAYFKYTHHNHCLCHLLPKGSRMRCAHQGFSTTVVLWHEAQQSPGVQGTDGSTGVEMPPHQAQSSTPSKHSLLCVHFHTHFHTVFIRSDKSRATIFFLCFFLFVFLSVSERKRIRQQHCCVNNYI